MTQAPSRHYPARRLAVWALAGVSAVALPVRAEPLVADITAGTRLLATDNIDLSVEGSEQSALVWTNSAAVTLQQQGARTYLSAGYVLDLDSILAEDRTDLDVRNDLQAVARGEILRHLLFADAQATVEERQERTGEGYSPSGSGRGDRTSVQTIRLSPYLTPRLGRTGRGELRYQYARAFTSSDRIPEPESNEGRAQADFALFGGRSRLGLLAELETTSGRDAGRDQRTGQLTFTHGLSRTLSVEAMGGWEYLESDSWGETFDSPIASLGLIVAPDRRTRLSLRGGWRYEDPYADLSFSYQPSPRSTLTAAYGRSFVSGIEAVAAPAFTIDPGTGLPVTRPQDPAGLIDGFGLGAESYRVENASLGGITRRGDSRLSLSFSLERRDYDVRADEDSYGLTAGWSQGLSRRLTLQTTGYWRRAEIADEPGSRDSGGATLGVTFEAAPDMDLVGTLSHARGERSGGNYRETALSVGLSWRF